MEEVNPSDSSRYRKTYLPYPQYRVKSTNANGHELFFVPAKEILRGACLVPVLDRREENFLFEDNVQYCTDERRGLWYSIPPERMYVRPSDCYQSLVDSEYDNNLARKSPLSAGKVFYSIEEMAEQQRSVEIAVERDQRALFRRGRKKHEVQLDRGSHHKMKEMRVTKNVLRMMMTLLANIQAMIQLLKIVRVKKAVSWILAIETVI